MLLQSWTLESSIGIAQMIDASEDLRVQVAALFSSPTTLKIQTSTQATLRYTIQQIDALSNSEAATALID